MDHYVMPQNLPEQHNVFENKYPQEIIKKQHHMSPITCKSAGFICVWSEEIKRWSHIEFH